MIQSGDNLEFNSILGLSSEDYVDCRMNLEIIEGKNWMKTKLDCFQIFKRFENLDEVYNSIDRKYQIKLNLEMKSFSV